MQKLTTILCSVCHTPLETHTDQELLKCRNAKTIADLQFVVDPEVVKAHGGFQTVFQAGRAN